MQEMLFWLCLLSSQSETMPGVTFLWQSTHNWAEASNVWAIAAETKTQLREIISVVRNRIRPIVSSFEMILILL